MKSETWNDVILAGHREFLRDDPAKLAFDALSRTHKREYILWVLSAKGEQTRTMRAKTMITMLTSKAKDA